MDLNVIMTMISTIGFPICCCIFLGVYFSKIQENYRQDIKEMQTLHKAESDKMTEALNNNTLALQRLVDKMEDKENDK